MKKNFGKVAVTALVLAMSMMSLSACGEDEEVLVDESIVEDANADSEDTAEETEEAAEETEEAAENIEEVDAEEADEEDAEVMSYSDYVAAELDSEVYVEVYVQAHQSWWDDTITVYAQDEDGAYFLYGMACSEEDAEKLVPGTKIRVDGFKSEWSGEVEIVDATFEFVEDGETFIADAKDVTDLLADSSLITYQNMFVSFQNMTVVSSSEDEDVAFLYSWDGSGSHDSNSDLYFNVMSPAGDVYTFTVESYLCDNTSDVYAAVEALQVGDVINLEGFLYWYEGVNPHITAVSAAN